MLRVWLCDPQRRPSAPFPFKQPCGRRKSSGGDPVEAPMNPLSMSKKPENPNPPEPPSFSEQDIAKARQCFARGQELSAKKNFDFAILMYIQGLEYWPEAVEEGHKPCR